MEERIEERKQTGKPEIELILYVAISYLLFRIGVGEPFFLIPLLVFAGRHGKQLGFIPMLVMAVAVVITTYFRGDYIGLFGVDVGLMIMAFQVYIPLSLLAAGMIWIVSRKLDWIKRIALMMVPSILFCLICFLLLEHDPALLEGVRAQYEDVFETMLSVIIDVEAVGEEFMAFFLEVFFMGLLSLTLPSVLAFICANIFISERILHSRETDFEDRMSHLELKGWMIWLLLGSWALVLLTRFVSMPNAVTVALFNVAICMAILYAVQGFSVVLYRLRNKGRNITSLGLVVFFTVTFLFLPGLNIIVVLGLPIIGAVESFFVLRR